MYWLQEVISRDITASELDPVNAVGGLLWAMVNVAVNVEPVTEMTETSSWFAPTSTVSKKPGTILAMLAGVTATVPIAISAATVVLTVLLMLSH